MAKELVINNAPGPRKKLVLVCPSCWTTSPLDASACRKCWRSLAGVAPVAEEEGEELSRRRLRLRRIVGRRNLLVGFMLLMGLLAWQVFALYDLTPIIFRPPEASTLVTAEPSEVGVWAQRGGDAGNTSYTPEFPPVPARVKWRFSTGIEWTYETRKSLVSSPAIAGNRVFVSTEDGRIVALDAGTGEGIWEYSGGSPSRATPVVAGGLVVAALRSGEAIALDRSSGTPVWTVKLEGLVYAPPIAIDGTVYVATIEGELIALDISNGKRRWSFKTGERIVSRVAYEEGSLAVVSEGNVVYVVDASTGRRSLIYDTERRRNEVGGGAVMGKTVYVGSAGGIIWALDRRAVTRPLGRSVFYWKVKLYEAQVFSRVPIQKGTVWVWRVGGDLLGSPAVGPQAVYFSTVQGRVLARDPSTGERVWATSIGEEITTAVSVAGDTALVGTSGGRLVGLDTEVGEVRWTFRVGRGSIADPPVVAGGTIYVVSQDGHLYALSK